MHWPRQAAILSLNRRYLMIVDGNSHNPANLREMLLNEGFVSTLEHTNRLGENGKVLLQQAIGNSLDGDFSNNVIVRDYLVWESMNAPDHNRALALVMCAETLGNDGTDETAEKERKLLCVSAMSHFSNLVSQNQGEFRIEWAPALIKTIRIVEEQGYKEIVSGILTQYMPAVLKATESAPRPEEADDFFLLNNSSYVWRCTV